jgi:pimeloyl-ACP methyl ester carboxylesterase
MLGHSLGGAVAGVYAGGFPERVSHFINVEGFAFRNNPPERGPEKLRNWLQGPKEIRFKVAKNVEAFAVKLTKVNPRLPLDRARFFAKYLTKKVKGGVMMKADPLHKMTDPYLLTRPIIYAFWEKITANCLLVLAEETEINQWMRAENFEKEMEERYRHFPKDSQVITLTKCGHMVHHEKPKELADAIMKFLK